MVMRIPNRHVETVKIRRTVQMKSRQVRQFVNGTGGRVLGGDDNKREHACGGDRKTSRREEMKAEDSPRRTIHRASILAIASATRRKCEKKQRLSPCSRQREVMLFKSPKS